MSDCIINYTFHYTFQIFLLWSITFVTKIKMYYLLCYDPNELTTRPVNMVLFL